MREEIIVAYHRDHHVDTNAGKRRTEKGMVLALRIIMPKNKLAFPCVNPRFYKNLVKYIALVLRFALFLVRE